MPNGNLSMGIVLPFSILGTTDAIFFCSVGDLSVICNYLNGHASFFFAFTGLPEGVLQSVPHDPLPTTHTHTRTPPLPAPLSRFLARSGMGEQPQSDRTEESDACQEGIETVNRGGDSLLTGECKKKDAWPINYASST